MNIFGLDFGFDFNPQKSFDTKLKEYEQELGKAKKGSFEEFALREYINTYKTAMKNGDWRFLSQINYDQFSQQNEGMLKRRYQEDIDAFPMDSFERFARDEFSQYIVDGAARKGARFQPEWATPEEYQKANESTLRAKFKGPDVPDAKETMGVVDFTSRSLHDALSAEALRAKMGRGRKTTFLTGPGGSASPPTLGRTLLGGG